MRIARRSGYWITTHKRTENAYTVIVWDRLHRAYTGHHGDADRAMLDGKRQAFELMRLRRELAAGL